MRLMPRSLFGRLLATAIVALIAALSFAALAIGNVLEHFVMRSLDDRLDAQIAVVARAVRPDGSIDATAAIDVPPFDQPNSGWSWEVRSPGGTLRSRSLGKEAIARPMPLPARPHRSHRDERPRPFEGMDPSGLSVHGRALRAATMRGEAEIIAVGPRAIVERPLRAAMVPLLLSLLLLGGALALAVLIQLRVGLRPLGRLCAMLAEVGAGHRTHIDADEPSELVPLVEELNALIETSRTALAQARGHVANLAHGLKTPLAALRLDMDDAATPTLARHVDRIDAQIRHHLGRARAASPGGAAPVADLATHVADLASAIGRIHAERGIIARIVLPADLSVRCDPQDLDEMVGNLLDNAWKWARGTVEIVGTPVGRTVDLQIHDDGPGISEPLLAAALEPGRRLDEAGDGHGFGLSITRELAELHGGTLSLANRPEGGLAAVLRLPSASIASAK